MKSKHQMNKNCRLPMHFITTIYCMHCVHCVGVDHFALKATVPTTHLHSSLHKLSFLKHTKMSPPPIFTAFTACTASTAWGFDLFCTKGNGPLHPYLLSPLCELTFLHQHLLHTASPHCMGFDLFALKVMVPTTHIC